MKIIATQKTQMVNHFHVKEDRLISIKRERKFKMKCPELWIKYLGRITIKEYDRIMEENQFWLSSIYPSDQS